MRRLALVVAILAALAAGCTARVCLDLQLHPDQPQPVRTAPAVS